MKFTFPFFGTSAQPPTTEGAQPTGQPAPHNPQADIRQLLTEAYSQRDDAKNKALELEASLIAGRDAFNGLKAEHSTLSDKLKAMETERDGLKAKVTELEAAAQKTRDEIRQDVVNKELATLAAAQGIKLGDLPQPGKTPEAGQTLGERLQATSDPFERAALRFAAFNGAPVATA